MNIKQALEHYGTQSKLAAALDVEQSNISKWNSSGVMPWHRQLELQMLTKGKLKADPKPRKANGELSRAA